MKKSIRHLSRHGRMFLVWMLVFSSIVPGALHAAAMAGPTAAVSGGHHSAGNFLSGDNSVDDHHHAGDAHSDSGQDSHPAGPDTMTDQCCPISCSFALCSFEPEKTAVFIPDSFEIQPIPVFVVTVMALPERPPRV